MSCIKFNTIISTNDYLKSYAKFHHLENFFCIRADEQTKGKGQRSNIWKSECCKNILVSFFVRYQIPVAKQFLLNQIVSIAVVEFLEKFNIKGLQIKYPNDILSGRKKISGILIENIIFKDKIKQSIIGIGLNVNQTDFDNLIFAVSMKNLTNQDYNLDVLTNELKEILKKMFEKDEKYITKQYEKYLFKPKASTLKKME